MLKQYISLLLITIFFTTLHAQKKSVKIDGELKKWHRITLNFEGLQTNEMDENNLFLSYRLYITFQNNAKEYEILGFYSAHGNAVETTSHSGNIWQVSFTPNSIGGHISHFSKRDIT